MIASGIRGFKVADLFEDEISDPGKAEMRRRWKQYLRPHVVRVSSTGELWCGANESQVREAVRTESVPKHRGFCAHCRAAYRRKSRG